MNKIMKGILTVGLVAVMATGMTACSSKGVTAYEIAVQNGFTGTEAEWLLSLRGANGADGENLDAQALYDTAKANGYEGSFLDFCKTLDLDVIQQNDTVTIAENMLSVVSIYCGYSVTTNAGGWFGAGTTTTYGSQAGSGVIVELNKEAGNAYIVTNYHVLYNKQSDEKGILSSIWVYPYGALNCFTAKEGDTRGDGIKATYVGGAMDYDIAILKIEGSEYLKNSEVRAAKLGNSDKVVVGEDTYAIGNPAGAGISVSNGILSVASEYIAMSALDERDLDGDRYVDTVAHLVMRTTAAINSGNSGGGLFNAKGELIGIVNAKNAQSTTDNMGYALPVSQVKAVYDNILANGGKVLQATLGITVAVQSSKAVVDENGHIVIEEEFVVAEEPTVATNGKNPAAYGKLYAGDRFISASINGGESVVFARKYHLTQFLLSVRKGDKVALTVCNTSGEEVVKEIAFEDWNFTTYA